MPRLNGNNLIGTLTSPAAGFDLEQHPILVARGRGYRPLTHAGLAWFKADAKGTLTRVAEGTEGAFPALLLRAESE
jgi:hypothetical protein